MSLRNMFLFSVDSSGISRVGKVGRVTGVGSWGVQLWEFQYNILVL